MESTYDPAVKAALDAALPGRTLSEADYAYWTNQGGVADGFVALADGTNWNPGGGAGFYGYRGGAWRKLD